MRERLITVVGVAGVGKSRLVLEVMRGERQRGRLPWHYVDLSDGQDALQALDDVEDGVLFLDNSDHRTAALGHRLAYVLAAHPRLRVVIAGREAWCLPAEVRYPLEGLALPSPDIDVISPQAVPEAVRLFVDRSAAVRPGFTANEDNVALISRICVRLAGLPLLIEFAAWLTGSLSLTEIADHACRDLRLLGARRSGKDVRHRSWRAALEPSHDALAETERLCLRRISILDGSFSSPTAHAVLRDRMTHSEVVVALTRLHEKSLLTVALCQPGSPPARFRVLEPVRLLAAEALTAAGEEETARELLANWAIEATVAIRSPYLPSFEELSRLEPESCKIGTVLANLLARQDPRAAMLCPAVTTFCQDRYDSGDQFRAAVARLAASSTPQHEHGWAIAVAAAQLATLRGDHNAAVRGLHHAALAGSQYAETAPATRRLYLELSMACESAGLDLDGLAAVQACLALSWDAGDEVMTAVCHSRLARHRLSQGADDDAAELLNRALPSLTAYRPAVHLAAALNVLGALALERADVAGAEQHFRDALRVADPRCAAAVESMTGLALCAARMMAPRRALRLLAANGTERADSAVTRRWASRIARAEATAKNTLSDRLVRECRRVGAAMRQPEAAAYAMRTYVPADDKPGVDELSGREWQIVTMVSRGLTNREIAARLFLSLRTIEANVRAVRRKIGLRSRTEMATWAVLRDPPVPDALSWDR